ncbi:hypothetical protein [Nostoc sp.]|uniref:hypothetical protein n=1 Tax=Nostoc sp. TaxID=1180 RepID=UPI002FF4D74F
MPLAGFPAERYANAYALWRFYRLIALFNEPQRRRGHRVRRERCLWRAFLRNATRTPTHSEDFAGDRLS